MSLRTTEGSAAIPTRNLKLVTCNYFRRRREYMQKEKLNRQTKSSKEGYIIMPNNFLAEWIRVIGKGPVLLYIQLLTYCHKEKDIAWPALSTLGDSLDMSKNSLISYQKTLLEYGLIKKTRGRRSAQGNYRSNLYKVTPMRSPKNGPGQVQNLDTGSPKIALDQVQNLHPNNTNLNSTNLTATTKREKDAVVVNFKKLREKGEERMRVIRERMVELDFKEEFVEKILKDYSTKKIEEKLYLLMERKNIQNPAGWLRTALKNDYQDPEQERHDEEPVGQAPHLSTENVKILSREEALQQIQLAKDRLDTITPSYQIKRRW